MTATVLRSLPEPRRRRRRALAACAAAVGALVVGGSSGRADQTVYFDEAGGAAPTISLVGDSTLTGVRWYADYGALEQYNFVFSAESCRRTIEQSCISREGYRAANVVSAMRALDGELGELLVVMSGYNDPAWSIGEAIVRVVDEARAQGVARVMWLSLRTNGVDYSDPQEQTSIDTFREYNEQLVEAAAASDGYLQIADWATYSNGASDWFEADGVHLTQRGADALTSFIADRVGRVLAGNDISPAAAPWSILVPGAEGDVVAAVQDALLAAGIDLAGGADGVYGNGTMAAVAEYQRRNSGLQVTGAVDEATARALGVSGQPDAGASSASTTIPAAASAVGATVPVTEPAEIAASPERTPGADDDAGPARWALGGAAALALAATAVGRRRYLVAKRAERRWARVHPATSPLRSVADMRRAGELPPQPNPDVGLYDHQLEEQAAVDAR